MTTPTIAIGISRATSHLRSVSATSASTAANRAAAFGQQAEHAALVDVGAGGEVDADHEHDEHRHRHLHEQRRVSA